MRSRWRLHLVMLCVTTISGINGLFTKAPLDGGLTPHTHMFCRSLGATILLWIASIWVPRERINLKDRGKMALASLTSILLNQGLFAIGMSMTSPVNQSLVATLGPIVTIPLAAVVLKEPTTRLKRIGVLAGAPGALLLISTSGSSTAGSTPGDLIYAIATISYAIYLTSFEALIQKYHPVTLMKWLFVISLLDSAPLGIRDMMRTRWSSSDATFYGQLVFIVVGATFVTYLLLFFAQKGLCPTTVSVYNYGVPVIASMLAVMMGQDQLTLTKAASAVPVLPGVFMMTRSKSRQ